jgi:hypothetical protein
MRGLRELNIRILDVMWRDQWLIMEKRLMEGVKDVRSPRVFEVTLPHPESNVGMDVGQSKCVFRRPGDGAVEREGYDEGGQFED